MRRNKVDLTRGAARIGQRPGDDLGQLFARAGGSRDMVGVVADRSSADPQLTPIPRFSRKDHRPGAFAKIDAVARLVKGPAGTGTDRLKRAKPGQYEFGDDIGARDDSRFITAGADQPHGGYQREDTGDTGIGDNDRRMDKTEMMPR